MKTDRNPHLLFNWIFITGLLLLALNDHIFKWQFSNWLTGKISDFSGLLILPMFIQFIFPKIKATLIIILCGLFFIFWKLPISDAFIAFYNRFAIITIVRIVDYSDLIALTVLPISNDLIKRIHNYRLFSSLRPSASYLIFIPSCLIFMATSPPTSFYMRPGGHIHIGKSYKMKISKEELLKRIKDKGYTIRPDTSKINPSGAQYYVIENVVLDKDTLKSIQLGFKGNLLLINNVSFNNDFKVSDWKTLRRYSKRYQVLIKSGFVEELK